MTSKRITVTIGKDGKTKVDAAGFTGGNCLDATRAIERALGAVDDQGRAMKPEYSVVDMSGADVTVQH